VVPFVLFTVGILASIAFPPLAFIVVPGMVHFYWPSESIPPEKHPPAHRLPQPSVSRNVFKHFTSSSPQHRFAPSMSLNGGPLGAAPISTLSPARTDASQEAAARGLSLRSSTRSGSRVAFSTNSRMLTAENPRLVPARTRRRASTPRRLIRPSLRSATDDEAASRDA